MTYRDLAQALIDGTEPIPLLDDLLAAWPDVRFNVDLKDAPAIGPLAAVLRRTGSWDRVCVTSFSAEQAARRAAGVRPAGVHGRLPDRHRGGPVRRPARAT